MITIKSQATMGDLLTKYALAFGVILLALEFAFYNYFAMILSCYTIAFILIFARIARKRRVKMLKIQAKRLDVYFGGFFNTEIKSFRLADLQGRFFNANALLGKPCSVLEITHDNATVCAVETRDGFEEEKLKTLFSLLNQIK